MVTISEMLRHLSKAGITHARVAEIANVHVNTIKSVSRSRADSRYSIGKCIEQLYAQYICGEPGKAQDFYFEIRQNRRMGLDAEPAIGTSATEAINTGTDHA